MNTKYLIAISGPTAIGKTALGIALAKHYETEIISCDSRQFYKEMYIGTAVPTPSELQSAKHHFIQHISIHDTYSVGHFEKDAIAFLTSCYEQYDDVIMVGGSGLYANAVLKGLDEFPEVPLHLRKQLNTAYAEEGLLPLQKQLKALDPKTYNTIALDNPQRVIRALEVCISSNKPYSSFLNKKKVTRNFIPISVGITAPREVIYQRINKRVDIMVEEGLVKEVEELIPFKKLNALNTVGYKELFEYFEGKMTLSEAIELIKRNTRRFAKRQLTWFKKDTDTIWFDYKTPVETVIKAIEQHKKKHNL